MMSWMKLTIHLPQSAHFDLIPSSIIPLYPLLKATTDAYVLSTQNHFLTHVILRKGVSFLFLKFKALQERSEITEF